MANMDPALQAAMDAITTKYQPRLDALTQRGQTIQDDFYAPGGVGAVIGTDIKVEWTDVSFSFDVPSVTIREQEFAFDLPQVTMVEQHWSFGVPDVCQKDTYPFPFPLNNTVIKVPYPCLRQVQIIFHLPSITMVTSRISMGVPEFTMVTQKLTLKLPQFTVINVRAEIATVEEQAEQLKDDATLLAADMKGEMDQAVASFLNPKGVGDTDKRNAIQQQYDAALTRISSGIAEAQASNADPSAVPDDNGGRVDLRARYVDLVARKQVTLQKFDDILNQIHDAHPGVVMQAAPAPV